MQRGGTLLRHTYHVWVIPVVSRQGGRGPRQPRCLGVGRAVAGLQLVEADDFSAFELTLPQTGISRFTYVGSTLVHEGETRFRLNFVTDDRDQLDASYRVFERESTANKLTIKRGRADSTSTATASPHGRTLASGSEEDD